MKAINVRGVKNHTGGSLLYVVTLDNGNMTDVFFPSGRVDCRPLVTEHGMGMNVDKTERAEALKAVALHVWK